MQRSTAIQQTLACPDILGMFSTTRLTVDGIQCALGVFPHGAAVGQPFEALMLLQNLLDQPVPLSVTIQLPRRDAAGNRIGLFTPQDTVQVTVQGGEVGLLHIPITPQMPTPVGSGHVMNLALDVRRPRTARTIRDANGGRVAGLLPMSPHRFVILQNEVGFGANVRQVPVASNMNTGLLRTTQTRTLIALSSTFDILPGQFDSQTKDMTARYESLWTPENLQQDQEKYALIEARAHQFSSGLTRSRVYQPLLAETEQRFKQVGVNLLPGELLAISKLLTYVMDDGLELEDGFRMADGRWFQRMTTYLTAPQVLENTPHLINLLYPSVMYDAVRLGYHMLARTVREPLGTAADHVAQANQLVSALEYKLPIDMQAVYMPLVMAGTMLHARVKTNDENLWSSLEQIRSAWQQRSASMPTLNALTESLLQSAEQTLVRTRVPRG